MGEVVVIIALLIGVDNDKPSNEVIIFILMPNIAQSASLIRSSFLMTSFGKNKLITQNNIAAPRTLAYSNAVGEIKSDINSFAIVWLNPNIEVAIKAAINPKYLLFI